MKKIVFVGLLLYSLTAASQNVPKTISFQGFLTDKITSEPLNGNFDMKFSLFDAQTGGAELWFDDYAALAVSKGLYSVILGDKKPIALAFDKVYYLQVKVGLETLDPRITLTASAYSLSSINASNITSGTLNGSLVGSGISASNITSGTLSGTVVGPGINATNITTGTLDSNVLDADVQDLSDGSLSGSKVGSGINATNLTAGTIDNARLDTDLQDLADGSLSGSLIGTGINATNITAGDLSLASGKFSVNGTTGNLSKINNVGYNFPALNPNAGTFLKSDDSNGTLSWANAVTSVGNGTTTATGAITFAAGTNIASIGVSGSTLTINAAGGLAGSGNNGNVAFWNSGSSVGDDNEFTWNGVTNVLGVNGTITTTSSIVAGSGTGSLNVGATSAFSVNGSGDITKLKGLSYSFPSSHSSSGAFLSNDGSGGLSWSNGLGIASGGTGASSAVNARSNLGLVIGTDIQPFDSDLSDLADGSLSGTKVGSGVDAGNITAGALAVVNGGTGATNASTARSNLGLGGLATLGTVGAAEITNGSITDGEINASAAIAGSKIVPAFGAQNISTTGSITGGSFSGSGSGLTSVPASSLTGANTLPAGVLPTTVPIGNGVTDRVSLWTGSGTVGSDVDLTWNGSTNTLSALNFTGNGSGLTAIPAASLTGTNTLPAGVLPTTVPIGTGTNGQVTFWTGTNAVSSGTGLTWNSGTSTLTATNHAGSGAGLTSLTAANVTGTNTLPASVLPTTVPIGNGVTDRVSLWTGGGTVGSDADLTWNGTTNTLSAVNFSGSGSGLTAIPAASLTGTNTLPSGVLPTNVPLGNGATDRLTFWTAAGAVGSDADLSWNSSTNTLSAMNIAGSGAAMTSLTAGNLIGSVAVGNGGTGATTAFDARTNLGLGGLATLSSVSTSEISNGTIDNVDISATASIADTKLATISTAGKVSGSAITSGTIAGSTSVSTSGTIGTTGSVGVGIASPTVQLDVVSSSTLAVVRITKNNASGSNLVEFYRTGSPQTPAGAISEAAGTVTYGNFTGSHYGMTNDEISIGEVVAITGPALHTRSNADSEPLYSVSVCVSPNSPAVLGSYLHDYDQEQYPMATSQVRAIMAVGNGVMWVVDNGKDISAGDYLISSDARGHAMLDNGDFDVANVIARAAENISWSEVTETVDGKRHRKISVFYESFKMDHRGGKLAAEVQALREELAQLRSLISRP